MFRTFVPSDSLTKQLSKLQEIRKGGKVLSLYLRKRLFEPRLFEGCLATCDPSCLVSRPKVASGNVKGAKGRKIGATQVHCHEQIQALQAPRVALSPS